MKKKTKNSDTISTSQKYKRVFLVLVGIIILVLGLLATGSIIYELYTGAFFGIFNDIGPHYSSIALKAVYLLRPAFGILAIVLGVELIFNKSRQAIVWGAFVLLFSIEIVLPRYLNTDIYLKSWNEMTNLVDTAVEEYPEFEDDENFVLHSNGLYGEKTNAASWKLQNSIDSMADKNVLISFLVGTISAGASGVIIALGFSKKK